MLRNGLLTALIIGALQLGSTLAFAQQESSGIVLYPSISMRHETGVASGDHTSYPMNVRLGYLISSGWFFGMMYSSVSGSGPGTPNETSYGNSVGYFRGPVSFIVSYYLASSSTEFTSQGIIKRTGGWGYQMDLGFSFPVTGSFKLGPVLSFKSLSYESVEDSSGLRGEAHTQSFIFPSFGILITF